jgi:hypothetical protein
VKIAADGKRRAELSESARLRELALINPDEHH